jgi:hypothetical protein
MGGLQVPLSVRLPLRLMLSAVLPLAVDSSQVPLLFRLASCRLL